MKKVRLALPSFPPDNIYPAEGEFSGEKEQWDESSLDRARLDDFISGLEKKERLAMPCRRALLSTFDNANPVFSLAVVKPHELKEKTAVRCLLNTIAYDEI